MQTAMHAEPSGTWLPLQEAATALHCSVDTVRRKAKSGGLISRQVPRPGGFTWEILTQVPTATPMQDAQDRTEVPTDVPTAPVGELVALIQRMHEENVQLAGQLGYTQRQLQEAHERIALLEAPVATVEANDAEHALPRPWWAFWRRRVDVVL